MKKDGSCYVNLGDTYSGNKKGKTDNKVSDYLKETTVRLNKKIGSVPEKSLSLIPSRFAIAMCERGWILRNDIIWHKKNAMPSSVLDRFTNKYEHVFFFTKSQKYYFDGDSIRIPFELDEKRPNGITREREYGYDSKYTGENAEAMGSPRARGARKYNSKEGTKDRVLEENARRFGLRRPTGSDYDRNPKGKNRGDVWTLTSEPYPEAHFAMFPQKLIEPIVLASCPKGGTVLDPFSGAATTGVVAKKFGRNYLGIELNPEYIKISERRLNSIPSPMF